MESGWRDGWRHGWRADGGRMEEGWRENELKEVNNLLLTLRKTNERGWRVDGGWMVGGV